MIQLKRLFIKAILAAALVVTGCSDSGENNTTTPDEQFAVFESFYLNQGDGEVGAPTSDAGIEALRSLEFAARAGHTEAQLHLGFMLSSGSILPKNRESGTYWLLLSAQQDNVDAQRLVGTQFAQRIYEPANDRFDDGAKTNAVHWLEKATEKGDLESQSLLSKLLVQDDETRERGLRLMKSAAELGDESAIEGMKLIEELQRPESQSTGE